MSGDIASYAYLLAAICFIFSIRGLSSPETARMGNLIGVAGMTIAVVATLATPEVPTYGLVFAGIIVGGVIGAFISLRAKFTQLPQLVALFNSFVGLAAVFIAGGAMHAPSLYGIEVVGGTMGMVDLIEIMLSTVIGAITFTGSVLAWAKLEGKVPGTPITFPAQSAVNGFIALFLVMAGFLFLGFGGESLFWAVTIVALVWGVMVVLPIGGADMPVVIAVLNSLSGWASVGIGFALNNPLMIVTGALVGASGIILSYIMCAAMNRSLLSVMLGGFGGEQAAAGAGAGAAHGLVKSGNADDAAFLLKNAGSVVIVPGYGMAVAQAQHALREMVDLLEAQGVKVRYAIHPVAGRMPGHMNVLLAEANVSYDKVFEMEAINRDLPNTDVAFVIGANDITNPAARTDPSSPIFGMPVIDVDKARMCMFVKRSMASGYAGVENPLFYNDNTMMIFGDAKAVCENVIRAMG
ncbi:NAD(P) transhydrogenase subunit beta [Constrictibacter sp. MBR-5]|jgi:NAD(P) transhydrogenase subunit beta|uniref:NAD(P)(+) transhydrogenase (Re/Si-specific) subunit beta n=1 Tax=Constrictibacter sp. MBR-5 TaxID=3156467 RepID=UPI003391B3FB